MKLKKISSALLLAVLMLTCYSCKNNPKEAAEREGQNMVYASAVTPFFDDWKLILGDGSNVGHANDYEHKDYF